MYKGASRIYPAYTRGWGAGARRAPLLVRTFAVRCSLAGPSLAASQLVRLGRWYATLPTSNVASERVFGVVRGLEDDQRRRASEETVTIETLARCNSWLVDVVRAKHGSL